MSVLAEQFDALLLDLDGTVYLGHRPIEHVATSIRSAATYGARAVYVTNNASRPPSDVAQQLVDMGLHAEPDDVLTSPQAASAMLAERHPQGSPVLVVGAPALAAEVARVGLRPVRAAADEPVAVVQGHSPETGWPILAEACIALRAGADWVAANVDATLPTDRGLLPGNGAMVSALMTATGLTPRVAGKPARPLIDAAIARFHSERPLVVGDRLDTDIEAAVNAAVPSLLVFTGVSTPAELLTAPPSQRPDYLGFDMRSLIDPDRVAPVPPIGDQWVVTDDGLALTLSRGPGVPTTPGSDADILESLAGLCAMSWQRPATAPVVVRAGDPAAEAALLRLGLQPT